MKRPVEARGKSASRSKQFRAAIEPGDLWILRGPLAKAERTFRSTLKVALANDDDRDLSVSHDRIGDVQVAQGNLAAALKAYEQDLGIAEKLAAADPGNAGWQRDLALSHGHAGMAMAGQGERDDAREALWQGREIIARPMRQSPDDARLLKDLAWLDAAIAKLAE
jgi:tetratricopeptide (TPR) repeat protein